MTFTATRQIQNKPLEKTFISIHTVGVCHGKPLHSQNETPFIAKYTVGVYCNTPLHNIETSLMANCTRGGQEPTLPESTTLFCAIKNL
jgi:hypothetical protein